MEREHFGTTATGTDVERITLSNGALQISVLTLGAVLQDVRLPGVPYGLTLGAQDVAAYEGPLISYGSIMGPVANRISNATAKIDGIAYHFERNINDLHVLHSGQCGTQAKVWSIEEVTESSLCLSLFLPDGEGGFPGNRRVEASYRLEGNALFLEISATTDAPTLMNFVNHSYWNLDGAQTYAGHRLTIAADRYVPITDELLPTGEIAEVAGTRFDFREGRVLAASSAEFYDHNFCLSDARQACRPVARLEGTKGITLDIATTEPGLQFFDGGTMNGGGFAGHLGAVYGAYHGLALETQAWPDAPNNPPFPSIVIRPDDHYLSETVFTFAGAPT